MEDGPLSLTSLEVENILRLKAFKLTMDPEGTLIIEGRNEQGKSSVIKSLELLLAGGKETPDAPLHGDKTRGHIIATFGELVVSKVFRKDKKPVLTITTKDGARMQAPQTMLDRLLSHVSLNPVGFMAKTDREKAVILSDLMGFDSSGFDAEIERLYNLRRDANREAKRLEALVTATTLHEDAPDAEVSVSDLMAELESRRKHNMGIIGLDMRISQHTAKRDSNAEMAANCEVRLSTLEAELQSEREALLTWQEQIAKEEAAIALHAETRQKMSPADETGISSKIAAADDINRKVRANVEREKAVTEAKVAQIEAAGYDKALEDETTKRERARLAARDRLPIPDLDITADAVLYKGKPLSQAGKSAELRVSVAVAIALNKDKRVKLLLIDDAEKLDADNVKVVMEMAHEAGFQVIMARVGDGQKASVVIEDGEVREKA